MLLKNTGKLIPFPFIEHAIP